MLTIKKNLKGNLDLKSQIFYHKNNPKMGKIKNLLKTQLFHNLINKIIVLYNWTKILTYYNNQKIINKILSKMSKSKMNRKKIKKLTQNNVRDNNIIQELQ